MALPESPEELKRIQSDIESKAKAELQSVKNAAINEAINTAITLAMNGMPPPLGVSAFGLSNAIYAALKAPALPTGVPSPNADPVKTFALMIAMAIVMLLWCFIKSLLNPLPIIGSFFPLCDPEGELVPDLDEVARKKANDQLAEAQKNAMDANEANDAANAGNADTAQNPGLSGVAGAAGSGGSGGSGAGAGGAAGAAGAGGQRGMTFEEFVAKTAPLSPGANTLGGASISPLTIGLNPTVATSANPIGQSATSNPLNTNTGNAGASALDSVQVTTGQEEITTGTLRNLFGL
jgi:hypothetical protein